MLTRFIDRIERKARRAGAVMERLQVHPEVLARLRGGTALAAVCRTCIACGEDEACDRWIADPSRSLNEMASFCPNARLFAGAQVVQFSRPNSASSVSLPA